MEKWVQIFKCIIFHSSTKSLIPALHKLTIRNLGLFFPFLGEKCCLLTDLSIFGKDGEKIVPSESRIAFCWLFIVRVKKVCYERTVRGKLLGWFFHSTLEWLRPYGPTASFRLMALQNRVECQCSNETNIPPN